MKSITKIFNSTVGGLVFSLLCGSAYFIIVLSFLLSTQGAGAGLMGLFLAPLIICGMALVIIKAAKKMIAEEDPRKLSIMMYSHIILMALSVVFLIDIIK